MTEQLPYGVTIKQASGASVWRVTECRHLPPAENRGGQNVFVKAFDQYGVRVHGLRVVYQRGNGQPLEYVPLDKPDNPAMEKGHGNIPIYPNDTITLGILGSTCDIVSGIHTRHPDELGPDGETWNSRGHHSWIVAFQRGAGSVVEPVVAQSSNVTSGAWAIAGCGWKAITSSKANTPIHRCCLINLVIMIAPYCGQLLGSGGSTRVKVAGPVMGTPQESNWKSAWLWAMM